jgi:hypothetical protein
MTAYSVYIQYFKDQHLESIGHPYDVNWGKDNQIMKQLVTTYDGKKVIRLIHLFFQEMKTDKFLQQTGATVGVFRTQIPKLLLKLKPDNGIRRGTW